MKCVSLLRSNSTKALYRFPTHYLKWQSPPTLKTVFFFPFADSFGNKICPELMQINSQSLFILCISTPFCFRSINMFVMGASRPHICGLIWYTEDTVFLKSTKSWIKKKKRKSDPKDHNTSRYCGCILYLEYTVSYRIGLRNIGSYPLPIHK